MNGSGLPRGVYLDKRRNVFRAEICLPKSSKKIYLGYFDDSKIAGWVYLDALQHIQKGLIVDKEGLCELREAWKPHRHAKAGPYEDVMREEEAA